MKLSWLHVHTPWRKKAVIMVVLMLLLAIFAGTPLRGSAAVIGEGTRSLNKAPSPVFIFRKYVNGQDANTSPGPYITQGTAITWTYYVENIGSASLSNILITDDNGTPGYPDDDFTVCIIDKINNNKSHTCSYTGTFQLGPYRNVATMVAQPPSGPLLTGTDPANYFGVTSGPSITIQKYTNGFDADLAPGPDIAQDDPVTWTYRVYNTGDVTLTDLEVIDDNGTQGNTGDDFQVCTQTTLEPRAGFECTWNGTAGLGQYKNVGTASATYGTNQVIDDDPSHYFGLGPSIDIEKTTNGFDADGSPGPYILVGDPVNWAYLVTNNGSQNLSDVTVTDDQGVSVTCPLTTLAKGEQMTCTASGIAEAGQYANLGTATGTPPGNLPDVSDDDASHYFGAQPSIHIEKHTNGQDADAAPGPSLLVGSAVSWEYLVSNDGNVDLSDVTVTDDQGVSVTCPQTTLDAGADMTCTASGTAAAGQYANLGTATGTPPGDLADVSNSDYSHYFGITEIEAQPAADLEKSTLGLDADTVPGPSVQEGATVTWTYTVTNTGNLTLFGLTVTDDSGTSAETGDDEIVCTIPNLNPGESEACSASGTAQQDQYTNIATLTGNYPGGTEQVLDSDTSNYFGVSLAEVQASADFQKATMGLDADTAPGPFLPTGETVTWTYTVTNTGNVTLFDLMVMDDNGTPSNTSDDFEVCTLSYLNPNEVGTCSADGKILEGQYTNVGTLAASVPGGLEEVTETDPSNYFGVAAAQPALDLEKDTNGYDADLAPGPFFPIDEPITWTYTFTNTGDVTVFDLTVMDDNGTPSDPGDDFEVCTLPWLAPDASDVCSKDGTTSAGQYTNIGTVTGSYPGGLSAVSDSDTSNYFGAQPSIALEKLTNGVDADTTPGPSIPVGGAITWTYNVTNTGNLTLSAIVVSDDNGTPADDSDDFEVCTIPSLGPDESSTCTLNGEATAGQYTNLGTVVGSPPDGLPDVSASDYSNYFGVLEPQPALTLQKSTNGVDADIPPGPSVLVGDTVTWTYTVSNPGNVTLFDILVTDDNGTPGDSADDFTVCEIASLDPDASETCTETGTATAGQYANLGTASGTPPGDSADVLVSDPSHYFGYLPEPEIEIQKFTNGIDADSAPGPTLFVGYRVTWEFTISNPGDETVTNLTVLDDSGTPDDDSDEITVCTLDSLAPLASHTCTLQGFVQKGQYVNVGTVTGSVNGKLVSASDQSYYFGENPLLYLPIISR